MSDFDAALERLVTDPSFAVALAADPAGALTGYDLLPDEVALLSAQVTGDHGGQRTVEERTSKASMFGLLAPLAGAAGLGSAHPDLAHTAHAGFGQAESTGFGGTTDPMGQSLGQGMGGSASHAIAGMGGQLTGGGALGNTLNGADDMIGQRLTDLGAGAGTGTDGFGTAELPPPADYHTRVDVNGDGQWDKHTYVGRADGGVDILADMNRDGRTDFVGHDFDRDGLVDSADYDNNRDGRFETHWFDDNGDGWLDRRIVSPEPPTNQNH